MRIFTTLFLFLGIIFYQTNAQQWVSTQVEKRNIILEEFTGIHCGFCPDGHRIANELATANPGRVFLVNIHAGGYATPQAGEPDLRTTVGTAIDAASGVAGYPAGSINRSTTPWAMSRGSWATVVSQIMDQNSPVNVAVKAYVDFTTRVLTTEVEIYYTSNSPASRNYLSVFLTQDNILGYQSDYGNFNPTNWTSDGKYRHNHALRMALSSGGAFGEAIDTTTKNHYEYRKYVTTLPQNITNLDVVLYNLHVVAFVAEAQNNIYSGAGTPVDFDQSLRVDLAMNDKTVYPSDYCFTSINPKIEVTNNSGRSVTAFDVSLLINGNDNVKSYSGSLASGDKTTIDWGVIPFSAKGSYSIAVKGFNNIIINGNPVNDMNFNNDGGIHNGIGFTSKAFSLFNADFDGQLPDNLALDHSRNPNFLMTNNPSCGANYSTGAIRYALHESWGMSGLPGYIVFGEAELSKLSKPFLCFYYAYSDDSYGGTAPKIKAEVTEDCGATWNEIYSMTATETGRPSQHGNWYVPATGDYKLVQIDLDAYKTKNVILRVAGIPGTGGNALYIDEISVGPAITGVEDNEIVTGMPLYPNPATTVIHLNNDNYIGLNYSIYSVLGNIVSNGMNVNNKIDINNLSSGQYYIKINNEILRFVKQ